MMAVFALSTLAFIFLCLLAVAFYFLWRAWQLAHAPRRPFSGEWERIIRHALPHYARWSREVQKHFQKKVQQFLAHKRFFGCAGLTVSDEMRVTVAAYACLLVMREPLKILPYPRIRKVQLYPAELVVRNGMKDVCGRSAAWWRRFWRTQHHANRVLLAWNDADATVTDFNEGRHSAMHQGVYVLLRSRGAFGSWAAVAADNDELAQSTVWQTAAGWQQQFGAQTPAEFFSAATEHFFERPQQLRKSFPDVYQSFQQHYQVDPSTWSKVTDG